MDQIAQIDEIEEILLREALWIVENAFTDSISDQMIDDPLDRQELIEANRNPKWQKPPDYKSEKERKKVSPFGGKDLDEEQKSFLKRRDYDRKPNIFIYQP